MINPEISLEFARKRASPDFASGNSSASAESFDSALKGSIASA
jgi:hypothetical protein